VPDVLKKHFHAFLGRNSLEKVRRRLDDFGPAAVTSRVRNLFAAFLGLSLIFAEQVPAATLTVRPGDIAAGAYGNLWFPEMSTGVVGRMTPAGFVTEFAISGAAALGQAIAPGPEGRGWGGGVGWGPRTHVSARAP